MRRPLCPPSRPPAVRRQHEEKDMWRSEINALIREPIGRFPEFDEDEPPCRLLAGDYAAFVPDTAGGPATAAAVTAT